MADRICLLNNRRKCQRTLFYFSYIISGIILYIIFLDSVYSQPSNCITCEQGSCNKHKCICYSGWEGDWCNKCRGKVNISLTKDGKMSQQGVLYDGSGNYSQETTCSWLLKADKPNSRVQLIFNEFATECIWDHLYVHDGDSAFSPLVAAFSGVFWNVKYKPRLKFLLTGQYAFIHFYSDAALTLSGFNISFIIDDCALECSENGDCVNGTCVCKPGWSGVNCDNSNGPQCPNSCSGNGVCSNASCICNPGFTGDDCLISSGGLNIEPPLSAVPRELTGRASMSFVFDEVDSLYTLGGYRMRDYNGSNNMFVYNVTSKMWSACSESKTTSLWPRHGHSAVYYKKSLYVYGGTYKNDIVKDFWKYDTEFQNWTVLPVGRRSVTGHTAHVYLDTMIVMFGYSSNYGYLNEVVQYNFTSGQWSLVKTSIILQGTYAHSSVFDKRSRKIYVYGGYQAHAAKGCVLTDKLYSYDPETHEWLKLKNSGTPRYLHSAAIINGMMLTFGGSLGSNPANDSLLKCFVSDFMLYDIDCDNWYTVSPPHIHRYFESLDRFGQSMVAVEDTTYVFGGFNSVLLNDLFKITLDNCDFFQNETQCNATGRGLKCTWLNNTCVREVSCPTSQDANVTCSGHTSCSTCNSASSGLCQWCQNKCLPASHTCSQNHSNCTDDCSNYYSCYACSEIDKCVWRNNQCVSGTKNNETNPCPQETCGDHKSCQNCTSAYCMWCGNLAKCVETNVYVVTFHYAQCMDWTTKVNECSAMNCSQQKTCSECQAKPECGWCNDETETGTGKCMEGGFTGPRTTSPASSSSASCPPERWTFEQCPLCQCNGHSKCFNGTNICISCEGNTTGAQCDECSNGFYGDAKNGGQCVPCSCNGQADTCNPNTGDCYCRTRGVTGKNCEKCDDSNKYSGNPKDGGTCYYPLNTDFQYTFNLSKKEDNNFTQINFLNTPLSSDRDVDFTLNCSTGALINITYKSKSFPEEKEYTSMKPCEYFRTKFEHKNHAFGGRENTTFLVYVFNFKTPFMLQISFVQPEKINLLKFFIIFFSCFLSLLLIAAALWKIKHKYDSYRRRQQLIVEMQQMASRPFSTIAVEIDHKSNQLVTVDKKDHLDSVLRRRKKTMNKPSAIAIETLSDHKAAILTLFIQLPTGDAEFAPSGQSGLAVGSALVSIGSHRKQSLEHAKGDKPKIRKNQMFNHPDTCA